MSPDDTVHTLSTRAAAAFRGYRDGEVRAMDELVDLLTPVLWHTARAQGAGDQLAQDAVQTAWLRLVEGAERIKDPQAVMGWLIVTVRRECWRSTRVAGRTDGELDEGTPDVQPDPATVAVRREDHRVLWAHVQRLTPRCQALLRVIAFADKPDYAAVSEALKMPVGSIGPTRGRCLAKLRTALADDPAWGGAL
ncbi:RNA polymerase sigma factor [Oryzobacter sp. R7]|uniref:RNA polymerase sigma factor n=1 Tax=Oryzobacter faecalis TaxID=3388656 RepID=UPI00398D6400